MALSQKRPPQIARSWDIQAATLGPQKTILYPKLASFSFLYEFQDVITAGFFSRFSLMRSLMGVFTTLADMLADMLANNLNAANSALRLSASAAVFERPDLCSK